METIATYIRDLIQMVMESGWRWFSMLNREEWMVVLAAGCVAGFFLLRGFGSRSSY